MASGALRRALFGVVAALLVANAVALSVLPRVTVAFRGAPSGLAKVLPRLMDFVEKTRGLDFTRTVVFETLDPSDFEGDGPKPSESEVALYVAQETAFYKALGLLPAASAPLDISPGAIQERIAGLYNSRDNRLKVRDVEPSPFVEEVLVHELTHALDDQHFDLARADLYVHDDEAGATFDALAEGDARWVEVQYVEAMSAGDQAAAQAARQKISGSGPAFPPAIEGLLSFPYSAGAAFVDALREQGGATRVNQAFRKPPTTTAQILEPERYLAPEDDGPSVRRPQPAGESFRRGSLGELFVYLMVSGTSDATAARTAAKAWAADRYVAYTADERACVSARISIRDGAEPRMLRDALQRWAASLPEATTASSGRSVEIRSCVAIPGFNG
jgi:hypothetical protein